MFKVNNLPSLDLEPGFPGSDHNDAITSLAGIVVGIVTGIVSGISENMAE